MQGMTHLDWQNESKYSSVKLHPHHFEAPPAPLQARKPSGLTEVIRKAFSSLTPALPALTPTSVSWAQAYSVTFWSIAKVFQFPGFVDHFILQMEYLKVC